MQEHSFYLKELFLFIFVSNIDHSLLLSKLQAYIFQGISLKICNNIVIGTQNLVQ